MKAQLYSSVSCHTLFPPWKPENWRRVDDSVRGGASKSYLEYWKGSKTDTVVFKGHLDITVLGGAGFASQKLEFSAPLDLRCPSKRHPSAGLKLSIRPQPRSGDMPSDFVVTLKVERPPPPSQPKPRSQLVYESTFTAPSPLDDPLSVVPIVLPFDSFTPTFRGRMVPPDSPQWKKLDLSQVYELGVMCRSEFGKQQGDFELVLEKVEVVGMKSNGRWKRCRTWIIDAISTFSRLEALLWARMTGLLCLNPIAKGDAIAYDHRKSKKKIKSVRGLMHCRRFTISLLVYRGFRHITGSLNCVTLA